MVKNRTISCARCGVLACKQEPGTQTHPSFCPAVGHEAVLDEVSAAYRADSELRRLAGEAARVEAAGYCRDTRVEEVMAYARRLGSSHLGIACCVGTLLEAHLAQTIFAANGFQVTCVACKVGSIPKEAIGLEDDEKIRPGQFEALCNPLGQAALLAEAGTQLNVVIGLCVGHDSLFFRHSVAPVTVLVAKDRVTGHNPAAALYTSGSYYRRLHET